ncbi:MAG: Rossmann-like and DUF2520 domain-containing protein [Saonia sp.]
MLSIALLGTGNVAKHLFDALLRQNEVQVVQVAGRNKEALTYFEKDIKITTNFDHIDDADIYIIAISDDAISLVSERLMDKKGLVVHTSGSVSMQALKRNQRRGVFYPLQTFSKTKKIDFKGIPICIEAANENDLKLLQLLGGAISNKVSEISSEQRESLHLAAVFVNNFTNHLYHIGHEICKENKVPFHMLKPLIMETAQKINDLTPLEAQTGAARRNDMETIRKHIHQLENNAYREIYSLLNQSIRKTYGEKL